MKKTLLLAVGLAGLVAGCAYDPYNGGYGYGPNRGPLVGAGGPPPVVVEQRRDDIDQRRAYRAGIRDGERRAYQEDRRGY